MAPAVENNNDATALKYSGFWRRFAALSIEISFYNLVFGTLVYLGDIDIQSLHLSATYWVVSLTFGFLYYTLMTYKYGGTLGKLFVGLQVRRATPDGTLSYLRSVARYVAYFLSLFTLGIGFFIQPFTKKKRALHDLIAQTEVVDLKRRPAGHIWLINLVYVVTTCFMQAVSFTGLD
ncbi:MAG: RDD family protein [Alcaligenaceae bacterium]